MTEKNLQQVLAQATSLRINKYLIDSFATVSTIIYVH